MGRPVYVQAPGTPSYVTGGVQAQQGGDPAYFGGDPAQYGSPALLESNIFPVFSTASKPYTPPNKFPAEVGDTVHEVPTLPLPYCQGNGFKPPQKASPSEFWPKLTAFQPISALLGVLTRKDSMVTIAVPIRQIAYGTGKFPKPPQPLVTDHLGFVTQWPQAQPLFSVMGG